MILGDSSKICEEMQKVYPKKFVSEGEILITFIAETGFLSAPPAGSPNIWFKH